MAYGLWYRLQSFMSRLRPDGILQTVPEPTYAEALASVFMYNRGVGNRSIVVCGGYNQSSFVTASCEELPIDTNGLPAASSWRSFALLPYALAGGCMLSVNGKVCVCWHCSRDIL